MKLSKKEWTFKRINEKFIYDKLFVGDERLREDCQKKMQITLRQWDTSFTYISLRKFGSFNHINLLLLFFLWVVKPLARGLGNGVHLVFLPMGFFFNQRKKERNKQT